MNWHRPRPFADPRGIHHLGVPTDRTSTQPFRATSGAVKVIDKQAPAVPEVPVLSAPVPARSAAVPAPLVTEVWLNRNILMGLQWDYRNLELFRAAAGDRYRLHELAMRAPCTITNGGRVA
jgi:hypothetical protein